MTNGKSSLYRVNHIPEMYSKSMNLQKHAQQYTYADQRVPLIDSSDMIVLLSEEIVIIEPAYAFVDNESQHYGLCENGMFHMTSKLLREFFTEIEDSREISV